MILKTCSYTSLLEFFCVSFMIKLTHIILGICIFTSLLEITTKHVIHVKKYSIQNVIIDTTKYIFFGLKNFKHLKQFKEKKMN